MEHWRLADIMASKSRSYFAFQAAFCHARHQPQKRSHHCTPIPNGSLKASLRAAAKPKPIAPTNSAIIPAFFTLAQP